VIDYAILVGSYLLFSTVQSHRNNCTLVIFTNEAVLRMLLYAPYSYIIFDLFDKVVIDFLVKT
jgi:hypothetical protein